MLISPDQNQGENSTMQKLLILMAALLTATTTHATQFFQFDVPISGLQQVPAQNVPGNGSYMVSYDDVSGAFCWQIDFQDLSGAATGMHFHNAPVGANGSVEVNVGTISGLTSPSDGCDVISPAQGVELLAGDWYLNIHTAAAPGGEIRGQAIGMYPSDSSDQTNARPLTGQDLVPIFGGRLNQAEGDHVDCFCVSVDSPDAFYVTSDDAIDPQAMSEVNDTRIWLWNYDGDLPISANDDSPGQAGNFSVVADPAGPISFPDPPQNPVTDSLQRGDAVVACLSYFDNDPVDIADTPLIDFGTAFEALNGPNPAAGPFDHYTNPGVAGNQEYTLAAQGARGCDARHELLHNTNFDRNVNYWSAPEPGTNLDRDPVGGNLTPLGAAQITRPDGGNYTLEQCIDIRYQNSDALYLAQWSANLPTSTMQFNLIAYATSDCQVQAFQSAFPFNAQPVGTWIHNSILQEAADLNVNGAASYKFQVTTSSAGANAFFLDDLSLMDVRIFRSGFGD